MASNKKSRLPPYQLGENINPAVHLNCVLLTTTVVNFLDLFQLPSVLFALPNIQQALKFTSEDINWVLIVYNITFATFLLIAGQLGQTFGLEKIFIAGTATLTVSNIINTTAPNKGALLAGRALSGVGAGLTAPNGLAILSNTFPDGDSRNKALAIYTACGPLGSTIGTVVGSLLASGVALLVYGLNDSSRNGWTSAAVLAGIILGVCLLFVFLWVEAKVLNPVIPGYLWKSAPFLVMLVAIFAFGGSFTRCLCGHRKRSLRYPLIRLAGEKNILVAGLAITAAGAVAWAFASPDRAGGTSHGEGYWYSIVAAIIFVIGSPVALVPTQSILLRQVEAGNHAVAGALFNTAYQVGASVILAGANALMDRSRESVQGVRQVTIDGYLNAFWLIAGVLGAAALTVMACYWPGKDGLVARQMEEAYAAEPLALDKVEKVVDATASCRSVAETR
ncbi:hypothetical protein CNMCM8980_002990 [Aspergillus fumigatiaffinis]|uniref:Major facilitator superfamily (MFS) profile domain-containing protein n=1 Tax=Aspergillus fumigatiaffinis TaxID=340414 RepID=A0A8H4GW06_9EURO|nr:hypothetical protein CNMCM5878_001244 [Aspergillus fumigatiaffinis]KAF4222807.1 hypothetical protein CNMCM6457_001123 [Aspergillus fumigatiaffinis]KAF4229765.1 hypothetical protein CNMCM6805_001157 [Aspergillus fumigatiaffinis]KAF4236218.1 hypothetical protein CNMCM8980_002990 [Aspergillus fumigatiaffinis]